MVFSTSGLLHATIPLYDVDRDPHLKAFRMCRSPHGATEACNAHHGNNMTKEPGRAVSVLALARQRREQERRDVLASNARLRRRLWGQRDAQHHVEQTDPLSMSRKSYDSWQGQHERQSGAVSPTRLSSSSMSKGTSPLRRLPPVNSPPPICAEIPFEHQNKLRVLEQLFEDFELAQAREAQRSEEEHHRILTKKMVAKRVLEEEAAALRLQFVCKRERKAMREAYPKLRRASSLYSSSSGEIL